MATKEQSIHADGIYFGLPEDVYHADPALGSTDLKNLLYDPAVYWHESPHNPNRDRSDDTKWKRVGSAVHKYVLEGPEAFGRLYAAEPDASALRTREDMAAWLSIRGVTIKPSARKPELVDAVKRTAAEYGLKDVVIYDDAVAAAEEQGKILLPADKMQRITEAALAIVHNPHLARAITGGAPEVSVFWTETINGQEVRRKARFDYLKPRAVVDLKSISPKRGASFFSDCRRAIANYRYDVQGAAYMQARQQATELAKAGQVFASQREVNADLVEAIKASDEFAFVLIFWASDGPPLTYGCTLSPGNPLLQFAEDAVTEALDRFATYKAEYGLAGPWLQYAPLEELAQEDMPLWFAR